MSRASTAKDKPTGVDAQPRSKYEPRDDETGRPLTILAVGVVVANAFSLLKDMLYGRQKIIGAAEAHGAGLSDTAVAIDPFGQRIPEEDLAPDSEPPQSPADDASANFDQTNLVKFPVRSRPLVLEHGDSFVHSPIGVGGLARPAPSPAAINDNGPARRSGGQGDLEGGDGGSGSVAPAAAETDETDEDGSDPRTNRAPTNANAVFLYDIFIGQSLLIGLGLLLAQSTDADGNPLDVTNLKVSSGSVVEIEPGLWLFTSEPERLGEVTFTYDVTDGETATTQTATLDVVQLPGRTVDGTNGADLLIASAGDDRVTGRDGDDTIVGLDGRDTLDGGAGNDRLIGGAAADVITGGSGNDELFGGDGDDTLFGGDGDDVIFGGSGNDSILGGAGNDTVSDGEGVDSVNLGTGNDLLLVTADGSVDVFDGSTGNDTISFSSIGSGRRVEINLDNGTATISPAASAVPGGEAAPAPVTDQLVGFENVVGSDEADLIIGDAGDNVIEAGLGADTVDAAAGDDTLIATSDEAVDAFDGGAGIDTYSVEALTSGATIDLESGTVTSSVAAVAVADAASEIEPAPVSAPLETTDEVVADVTPEIDTIVRFENVIGSGHADTIIGDAGDNVIDAGLGDDLVLAGAGDDTVVVGVADGTDHYDGGTGQDTLDASAADVSIVIDLSAGTISATDSETDTIENFEAVVAGAGNDTIIAGFEQNDMWGGLGEDIFVFRTTATTGSGKGSRDRILDYSVGDRVDLDGIITEFAPTELVDEIADQNIKKFVLIRDGEEFSRPGQLKIAYEDVDGQTVAVLQGTANWDSTADFEIEIHGLTQDTLYF